MTIRSKIVLTGFVCFVLGISTAIGLYQSFVKETEISIYEYEVLPAIERDNEETIPQEFIDRLSLFILAGQSNMSGRGEIRSEPLPVNPRVFVFGNDYRWHYGIEPMDPA